MVIMVFGVSLFFLKQIFILLSGVKTYFNGVNGVWC